ncbi:hypothetical protein ANN_23740 [Periplaneta americana]|uniref:Reverse transcriptase n=1 Tax=Periplaneta americana TaxID=6978 RepID=A0ABQ8SLW8_PERAM|nr:hypothetical protein ANN_23740 [Periplaneta americana]
MIHSFANPPSRGLRLYSRPAELSLMLAGNEFQSLGRAIVKEDEYEEVRWDGIVSIVSWRERVFRLWWEERMMDGQDDEWMNGQDDEWMNGQDDEWPIDALKIVGYVSPVRAVPGRSRDGTRCRRCLSEIETLPHILGFCPYSEALRNIRHHSVCSMLVEALKELGFTVHQEVQGLATQGSVRRIDIIAIKNNSGYILDPTIRFETNADQPHEVDSEKKTSMNQQSRSIKINIACLALM